MARQRKQPIKKTPTPAEIKAIVNSQDRSWQNEFYMLCLDDHASLIGRILRSLVTNIFERSARLEQLMSLAPENMDPDGLLKKGLKEIATKLYSKVDAKAINAAKQQKHRAKKRTAEKLNLLSKVQVPVITRTLPVVTPKP
jgi:hypothetical protein